MFKLLRFILNGLFYIAFTLLILYFLPEGLKKSILNAIDSLVIRQPEREEIIIQQLEKNLNEISTDSDVNKIIEESRQLIWELKEKIK